MLLLFRSHCFFIDSQVFQLKLWILLGELVFIKRGHPSLTPYFLVSEQWGREMVPWNWGYYWIAGCTFYAKGWFSRSWGNFCGWQNNVIPTHLLLTGWSSSSPAYAHSHTHCPLLAPRVLSMGMSSLSVHIWPPFRSCSDVTFSMKPSPVPSSLELSSSKLSLACKFILCRSSQASYVIPSCLQLAWKLQEGEHPWWWWKGGGNCYSILGVRWGFNVSMWWLRSWVWCIMNAQEMLAVIIWLENAPSNFTPLLRISLQLKTLSSAIIHAVQPQRNISLDSRSFIPVLGAPLR